MTTSAWTVMGVTYSDRGAAEQAAYAEATRRADARIARGDTRGNVLGSCDVVCADGEFAGQVACRVNSNGSMPAR